MVQTCVVPQVLAIVLNATVTVIVRRVVVALQIKPSVVLMKKMVYVCAVLVAKQTKLAIVPAVTVMAVAHQPVVLVLLQKDRVQMGRIFVVVVQNILAIAVDVIVTVFAH